MNIKSAVAIILASVSSLWAEDFYTYFASNPTAAPNGESIVYIPDIKLLSFGDKAESGSSSPTLNNAIFYKSTSIKSWATGYMDMQYGTASSNTIAPEWKTPENAIGAVNSSDPTEKVVCLGDGGSITLSFANGIGNGDGADFAVFENGFDANYLELAYVEVSTNGTDFLRFPNFYLGEVQVDESSDMYPTQVYNLASKYESGYGHAFDLEELEFAYKYALSDGSSFSEEYLNHILTNYPLVDLDNIQYVRIIDIYGDGSCVDSAGHVIYDPCGPNYSAPGFDLKGVGVINEAVAVPEPAEYAAILGAMGFVVAILMRRRA